MALPVCPAITNYHRVGGSETTGIYLLTFWKLEDQEQDVNMGEVLVRTLF